MNIKHVIPWMLLAILATTAPVAAQTAGLRVPAGFEVTEFADASLANDIYTMTIDPRGRVVVSGRGYIRLLLDDDNNGRADRAVDFAREPKDGAMGLYWEGTHLYFTGDGGLRRLTEKDGKAAGPSELLLPLKTGGEHTAHDIRRGPDGYLYILCGNNTNIDKDYAQLPNSPIKNPTAGVVLRFDERLKATGIVAHGFRNPYGMDFNLDGELFTFDSDNERCVSLPWYEFTRFYHVREGGHYGWLSPQKAQFWRRPPYFPDVVPPLAYLGRGSPTGIACYRHTQFPEEYRGGFFLCDWTFGKIHFAPLTRHGDTYATKPNVFLEATGDNGFAPTGIAVHPKTGDLFVAIGGRGTRGGVYRVRYPKGVRPDLEALKIAKNTNLSVFKSPLDLPTEPDQRRQFVARLFDMNPKDAPGRLERVRALQLLMGDVGAREFLGTLWEGYTTPYPLAVDDPLRARFAEVFKKEFLTGQTDLDRELARTLAMLDSSDDGLRDRLTTLFTPPAHPTDDLHYLAVYARLGGKRTEVETTRIAATLLDLDRKVLERKLNRDSHWPLRLGELFVGLLEKDPRLAPALLTHPAFGRPDHALFARNLGKDRQHAATLFLARMTRDAAYPATPDVIAVLDHLPTAKTGPILRRYWGQAGLDAALLPLLAREPVAADRHKFVDGLTSPQLATVTVCLDALAKLSQVKDGDEPLALLRALGNLPDKQDALRERLTRRLVEITGQKELGNQRDRWLTWFKNTYPEHAAKLTNTDGVDVARWTKRLESLNWSTGDPQRGLKTFHKASCIHCHSGAQALGPDLVGVTQRFSRTDLFTAILQPSQTVPARYQTTLVETTEGKVYQGVVIYDAVDGIILQTGATATVRIPGSAISLRRLSPTSLMPAGLLDPLSDDEILDLYAYLRRLGKK